MKVLFDTSALIAAFIESHPKHMDALSWLEQALTSKLEYYVSSHSIFEVYSVLTRAPFKPKINPTTARKLIEDNIIKDAALITLSKSDVFSLLAELEKGKLTGGIVYDAIILKCGVKAKVNAIITGNSNHFSRIKEVNKNNIDILSI